MKKTEISTLGEFGLIEHITKSIELKNSSTIKGVGDDAAVLCYGDKKTLVSTDLLMEGIDFDLMYFPLKHLGYKSAIAGFSDIYAMNGQPKQLTVSLGLSQRFSVEDVEDFYAGVYLACNEYGVDVVGGDTSASLTGFTISVTCIGESGDNTVYRKGARDTDLVCVSGDLGAAYMGLQLLEREKSLFAASGDKLFQPDFSGKEYILERQLKPEARKDIIKLLADNSIVPTSMIDITDGLSSELKHICKQSGVGCRIFEDRLPLDYQTASMAEQFNMNVTTVAMNGGDDYELLFTVPLFEHEKVSKIEGVHVIGHITKEDYGLFLETRDGTEIELQAQGWKKEEE